MITSRSLFLSVLIISSITACKRSVTPVTYHGKLIRKDGCGVSTIQVSRAPFPPGLDSSWTYQLNDSVYKNVFGAGNPTLIQNAGLNTGDSISFTIGTPPPGSPALTNTCNILYTPPRAYNYLETVQKIN